MVCSMTLVQLQAIWKLSQIRLKKGQNAVGRNPTLYYKQITNMLNLDLTWISSYL